MSDLLSSARSGTGGLTPLGLFLSTFTVCLVSSVFPLVNAELYLVSVSAVSSSQLIFPLILVATVAQMIGKSLMYLCGRGAVQLPGDRIKRKVAEVERRFKDRRVLSDLFLFVSAATGLPPFYVVSIAAGMLNVSFTRFLWFGFCGRLVRFAVVIVFPQVVKHLWPAG